MGVFVPSILMVFGVIIFLRLGWIVGQAGLLATLVIVTLSSIIALITTLSMASIATNINMGKGGIYYILSRSLGIEVGSSIGVPLYLKQSLSIAFCVIGFAESLHDLIPSFSILSISLGSLFILALLAYFSLSGALKVQMGIFILLIGSLVSLFMGGEGSIPLDIQSGAGEFIPEAPRSLGFWTIFAIFFPAMTGIESSVSLSGDLRNPSKSLPIGTISAVLVAYAVYMLIPIFLARNASETLLVNNPFIMQHIAKVPSLIILGIWGATISSALGGLLGAPRTLQALSEDGIVPAIFGKTYGRTHEPRIATLTTCLIAACGIYFGSVNLIAPLLTMICLICYGVVNFSAGIETAMANPSWRPRFKIHWSLSIIGAILCLMTMMMIDAGSAIIALALIGLIYMMAKRRRLSSSWDDIRQGILLFFSRFAIYRLAHAETTSKSWRPHFLVFTDQPEGYLLHFSQAISQSKGFLTIASFLSSPLKDEQERNALQKKMAQQLKEKEIHALVQIGYCENIVSGMSQMIENYGLGTLIPNTIVCGKINEEETENFGQLIRKAHQHHRNILIFNGDKNRTSSPAKEIHIWWDSNHRKNGELMLVLAHMLNGNPAWKKAKIFLKAIAPRELARAEVLTGLRQLCVDNRFPVTIDVLVSPSEPFTSSPYDDKNLFELISTFSKEADLLFVGLLPPPEETNSSSCFGLHYAAYLKSMSQFTKELPPTVLVLSSTETPLECIFGSK